MWRKRKRRKAQTTWRRRRSKRKRSKWTSRRCLQQRCMYTPIFICLFLLLSSSSIDRCMADLKSFFFIFRSTHPHRSLLWPPSSSSSSDEPLGTQTCPYRMGRTIWRRRRRRRQATGLSRQQQQQHEEEEEESVAQEFPEHIEVLPDSHQMPSAREWIPFLFFVISVCGCFGESGPLVDGDGQAHREEPDPQDVCPRAALQLTTTQRRRHFAIRIIQVQSSRGVRRRAVHAVRVRQGSRHHAVYVSGSWAEPEERRRWERAAAKGEGGWWCWCWWLCDHGLAGDGRHAH